jgi:tetratricopeptide (TPR) repeat protein
MRTPNEIAEQAFRDEAYARAAFVDLIKLPANEFRAAVKRDRRAQSEFMAKRILDYLDEHHRSVPPEHALELAEAARLAARRGEPHVRCRAEKTLGIALNDLGSQRSAGMAASRARALTAKCLAPGPHRAMVVFMRALISDAAGRLAQAKRLVERAALEFDKNGAHDRAFRVRQFEAYRRVQYGDYLSGLVAAKEAAYRARQAECVPEEAHAYYNIGIFYRGLSDFPAAQRFFRKSANLYRRLGSTILEAKSLRCVARMSIRMKGESVILEMDPSKDLFVSLNAAGEACRSTVAIIQELIGRDSATDIRPYCKLLEEEGRTFGVLLPVRCIIDRLYAAAVDRTITDEFLQEVWDAFGPTHVQTCISAVATVEQ